MESGNTRGVMNPEPGFEVEEGQAWIFYFILFIYLFSCESNLINIYWIYINKESKKKERKDIK